MLEKFTGVNKKQFSWWNLTRQFLNWDMKKVSISPLVKDSFRLVTGDRHYHFLWVKNFQKLTKEVFDGLLQIPITFCEFGDDSHFHLRKVWKNLIESSQKNPIDTLPDSFKILQILARQLQEFPTNIHPWSLFWGLGSTSPLYIIFSIWKWALF